MNGDYRASMKAVESIYGKCLATKIDSKNPWWAIWPIHHHFHFPKARTMRLAWIAAEDFIIEYRKSGRIPEQEMLELIKLLYPDFRLFPGDSRSGWAVRVKGEHSKAIGEGSTQRESIFAAYIHCKSIASEAI